MLRLQALMLMPQALFSTKPPSKPPDIFKVLYQRSEHIVYQAPADYDMLPVQDGDRQALVSQRPVQLLQTRWAGGSSAQYGS